MNKPMLLWTEECGDPGGQLESLIFVWLEFVVLWTLICFYHYILVTKPALAYVESMEDYEKAQAADKLRKQEEDKQEKLEEKEFTEKVNDPVLTALKQKVELLEKINNKPAPQADYWTLEQSQEASDSQQLLGHNDSHERI